MTRGACARVRDGGAVRGHRARRVPVAALALVAVAVVLGLVRPAPADAAPAKINGAGSSYVALAMQQWVADGQTSGLQVNYLPNGSPQGMQSYGQSLIDFAGTEAEFSALQANGGESVRGFQYVPDVAGATAVLYNAQDKAGRKVDYLHLSRRTIARIFTGDICSWSDPAISADNKGLLLPDETIKVVYRSGQSGTTGTFYDFVANTAPDVFGPWAAKNQLPTNVRIIQLDSAPNFACKSQAFNGPDQIAQYVASDAGRWSISYAEFGYSKVYHAPAAWVQNAAGEWVLPYAENISAALEAARLRPDLSQELSGVYASANPKAYPISAYSYLVTQCKEAPDRGTCKGEYPNSGVSETLTTWMRYIACDGQVNMARIGYSPLPPNLSQEVANAIGRLQGRPAEQLNASNCANPRFSGSLGTDSASPSDPLAKVQSIGPGPGGAAGAGGGAAKAGNAPRAGAAATGAGAAAAGAAGETTGTDPAAASADAVAAETEDAAGPANRSAEILVRQSAPVAVVKDRVPFLTFLPPAVLVALLVVPPVFLGARRSRRASAAGKG